MRVLSEEKIEELWHSSGAPHTGVIGFARAIEAAVLEAQKQEPGYFALTKDHTWISVTKNTFDNCAESHRMVCYATPVVQPDMVMVPREPTEAMLDAAMNRYKHVSPEAKARYTQMHRENFRCDYKAMIAAAEGK